MKTGSQTIYVLLDRDQEAQEIFNELIKLIGYPVSKDMAKEYPRLLELRQELRKELY